MRTGPVLVRLIALTLLVLLPATAFAVDGVIEINHARALAGNVTPGDTPGYPVTVSLPGSYRLTGNLTQANAGTHVIEVTASSATIDLNGFGLRGATTCTRGPGPTTCAPVGQGHGIKATGEVTVHGGRIEGISGYGVMGGSNATLRVSEVTFTNIAGTAIYNTSSSPSLVERCLVDGVGMMGIAIGSGIVRDSAVAYCGDYGIVANRASVVSGCTVAFAVGGIYADGALVHNCSVYSTSEVGVNARDALLVETLVRKSDGYGIENDDGVTTLGSNVILEATQGQIQAPGKVVVTAPNSCPSNNLPAFCP